MSARWRIGALMLALFGISPTWAEVARPRPVSAVGDQIVIVNTQSGSGALMVFANAAWSAPNPDITRVVLVVHGLGRNADGYFAVAEKALVEAGQAAAHTLIVAPHLLADDDITVHKLGSQILHWRWNQWASGESALGPIQASSFEVLDALLAPLADKARYPALKQVVVAGHSAGAQLVQRYAVVGDGEAALTARGVAVRYVVANPSSYLYLDPARPVDPGPCPAVNRWRYGLAEHVPPYVTLPAPALERRYIARDVVYLLGTADTNPHHLQLDRSCAGEAQGPYRYARGLNYLRMLKLHDGDAVRHRVIEVPGVAHEGGRMLLSACGRAALFDAPGCTGP